MRSLLINKRYRLVLLILISLLLQVPGFAQDDQDTDSLFFCRYAHDETNQIKRSLRYPTLFTVNDISNGSWQLTVPQQQFSSSGVEIKVSPLSYVEMDTSLGTAIGGLMFEPSGLLLSNPIKVNITIQENFERPLLFLLFDANGELSHVPVQQVNGHEYTIEVPHFSGLVAIEPSNSSKLCTLGRIQLQLAIQEGEKLLSNQPRLGAEPMSVNSVCKRIDNKFNALIDTNVVAMLEPEYSVINKILNAHALAAICQNGDVDDAIPFPEVLRKLLAQNAKKGLMALDQYQYDPEKYIAVVRMAVTADREYCLLYDLKINPQLTDAVIRYLKNNRAYYRHKIAAEHDLIYFGEFYNTYREVALFNYEEIEENPLFEELKKIYRFEMELEIKVKAIYEGTDPYQKDESTTKGKVELVLDFNQYGVGMAFPSEGYNIALEGSGTFVSSGTSVHQNRDKDSQSQMIETPFQKRYRVEMNLCESFGKVRIYDPGKFTEKWEGDEPLTTSLHYRFNLTNNTLYVLEFPGIEDFVFPFNIEAGQQVMFEHTYRGQKSYDEGKTKYEADLNLKITHAPK